MNLESRIKMIEMAQADQHTKAEWFDAMLARMPTTVIAALVQKPANQEASLTQTYYQMLGKKFGIDNLTVEVYDTARELIQRDLLVEAIKTIRSFTGAGLKPSKDLVEWIRDQQGTRAPYRAPW